MKNIKIGVSPLSWINSDIPSLGAHIPIEQCLSEAALIGYQGVELEDPMRRVLPKLSSLLQARQLSLIGGWHSTYLLENSIKIELERLKEHLDLLERFDCSLAILADCSFSIHRDAQAPLSKRLALADKDWIRLCQGIQTLHDYAEGRGFTTTYHVHMGTLIQKQEEITTLMNHTTGIGLLFDTGHLAYSQEDYLTILDLHMDRINHIHLKNIRKPLLEKHLLNDSSFIHAILDGVFTTPGDDGSSYREGIDFLPIIERLLSAGYSGWWVVEAEQDPGKADPLTYAKLGYTTLRYLIEKASLQLSKRALNKRDAKVELCR